MRGDAAGGQGVGADPLAGVIERDALRKLQQRARGRAVNGAAGVFDVAIWVAIRMILSPSAAMIAGIACLQTRKEPGDVDVHGAAPLRFVHLCDPGRCRMRFQRRPQPGGRRTRDRQRLKRR